MEDLLEILQNKEFQKFDKALGAEKDPVMLILRAHLFTETLLERIINFKLPRGDKILENANLTYHQKLVVCDALKIIDDSYISSLRNLNKIRNQCAHELNNTITDTDITRLGSPLGKKFTEMRKRSKFDDAVLLKSVVTNVCAHLAGVCSVTEHPDLTSSSQKHEKASSPEPTKKPVRKKPAVKKG